MKKFFTSPFGKRVLVAILLVAIAVALGIGMQDFLGKESPMLHRFLYCLVVFGTGLGGLCCLYSYPAILYGYFFVLLIVLPKVLPEPWNRYFSFVYLAGLLLVPALLKRRKKRPESDPEEDLALEDEEEELLEEQLLPDEGSVLAYQHISGRFFQLFRRSGQLCAYRIGGEIKGINPDLVLHAGEQRPLGKKDFSIPLEEIRSIKMKENETYGVIIHMKAAGKLYQFVPVGNDEQSVESLSAFFRQLAPSAVSEDEIVAEAPVEARSLQRRKTLQVVCNVLLGAVAVIALPWLFLDVPYKLFATLSLLPFPIALALACIFPEDITINESRRKSTKVSVLNVLVFSGFAPALRSLLDFNFVSWTKLLFWVLGLAAVIAILLYIFCAECRKKVSTVLAIAFFAMFFCFGAVTQLNFLLDFSNPVEKAAVIEEMHISTSSKSPDTYNLDVVTSDSQKLELKVSREQYETLSVGDSVTVYIQEGALHIPYAYAD